MNADTRLFRGDRVRCLPDPDWPGLDAPPDGIWELVCDARPADDNPNLDPQLRGTGLWHLHIRWVTPGQGDYSAVGDQGSMGVRMDQLEFVSRAAEPGKPCEWECW